MDRPTANSDRQVGNVATVHRLLRTVIATTVILAAGCGATTGDGRFEGLEVDPIDMPALTLTDTSGATYDLSRDSEGKVKLVYFGYTNCPDICPIHLSQLSAVLERAGSPANVEVIFVTTDPSRDTPQRMREYLDAYSQSFVGLTGSEEELIAGQQAFGAIVAVRESDAENYTMGHDGRVFAFTPDGIGYTQYPHPTRQSSWLHDLPILAGSGGTGLPPG
jgi:protein SCO1/2